VEKGAPTDRRGMPMKREGAPMVPPVDRCSNEWPGSAYEKKAGIRQKEPASRRTQASHERCERERRRKKEDYIVREV
jgi:hypothetical protein